MKAIFGFESVILPNNGQRDRHFRANKLSHKQSFTTFSVAKRLKMVRATNRVGATSSFLFIVLVLAIIFPLYNIMGTEDTKAAVGTAIDSSITFTSTRTTATVDLTPTSTSGTFASSTSGTTDAAFSITTTNSQGYELKIKSASGTVLKPNTTTSDSDGLSTITTSGITSSSFTNNTWGYLPNYYNCNEASGACTANTTNYYPATTSDVTLRKTTSANTTAHNYTIGLGAKADLTKTSGTYTLGGNSNSMVLSYVANPTTYSIAYDKGNATGTPSNMPSTQSGSVSATSVTLSSTTPTLTGYTFTGWCLGTVSTSSAEVDSCTGTGAKTFAAGASFGLDRTSTNSVTLHAMWTRASVNVTVNFAGSGVTGVTFTNSPYGNVGVSTSGGTAVLKYGVSYTITGTYSSGYEFSSWAATAGTLGSTTLASTTYSTTTTATLTLTGKSSIISLGYMQDLTLDACKVATTSGYGATDKRDGKVYSVRYINDYCWMTQNLAYLGDTGSATGTMTIGNNNSNTSNTSTPITLYSLNSSNQGNFGAYTDHCDNTNGYNYACVYDSGSTETGVWYNYYAASAGTISTDSNNTAATQDICPKNWHLPTGPNVTSGTDINKLVGNTTSGWQNPTTGLTAFSAVAGGRYSNGSLGITGYGFWWSATTDNTAHRYYLGYDSSDSTFNGNVSFSRYYGYYARCVMTPTMQDATFSSLADLMPNVGDTATLIDSRDGESYLVAKLADGNIWMLDNLALDLVAKKDILSSSNTNATDAELGYLKGTSTGTTSDKYATAAIANWTSSNSYSAPLQSLTDKDKTVTSYGSGSGKVGGYYNYCAASAGTYCYASYSTFSGDATADICPKGWRMPTSGVGSGEYNVLYYTAYSENASNFRTALSTPLSGFFYDGSAYYQDSSGSFWSSTRNDNTNMSGLIVDSSGVNPTNSYSRDSGYSVRCVMTPPTMQDATSSSLADLMPNVGDTATLIDSRDGESYLIGHLADGKYWMLDNLRLGSTSTISLNSSNTNLPSGVTWTLPASGSWSNSYTTAYINSTDKDKTTTSYGSGSGKIGVYYNYCAASAGNICASSNSNNGSADRDICPKGWRMPTGGSSGEYQALYAAYSSNASNFRTALSTPLSGSFNNGSADNQGSFGDFWCSTRSNDYAMYRLYVASSNVESAYGSSNYYGFSVRCVLK